MNLNIKMLVMIESEISLHYFSVQVMESSDQFTVS